MNVERREEEAGHGTSGAGGSRARRSLSLGIVIALGWMGFELLRGDAAAQDVLFALVVGGIHAAAVYVYLGMSARR